MNSIRRINDINQKELKSKTDYKASWHYEYRDTNYIYIGNLPFNLKELDILKIFSQYGIPTHINLIKDKVSGKSKGFAFLKYENFKSCILAIDNLNGFKIGDRFLKVDHNYYTLYGNDVEDNYKINYEKILRESGEYIDQSKLIKEKEKEEKKKLIKDRIETRNNDNKGENDDFEDPMANYVNSEKTKEVETKGLIESSSNAGNDEDDEFKDPMANFIKLEKEPREKKVKRSDKVKKGLFKDTTNLKDSLEQAKEESNLPVDSVDQNKRKLEENKEEQVVTGDDNTFKDPLEEYIKRKQSAKKDKKRHKSK
ncbi:unnamed protein product [Candida verbasci]|uniref:RRM domain-containing protein n=1 Tax=Candida verbasci TaxID=1227364 RepID=A0A9W4TXP1_9ASCO|nr:unnamed protein product [Candida verbasci]